MGVNGSHVGGTGVPREASTHAKKATLKATNGFSHAENGSSTSASLDGSGISGGKLKRVRDEGLTDARLEVSPCEPGSGGKRSKFSSDWEDARSADGESTASTGMDVLEDGEVEDGEISMPAVGGMMGAVGAV